jgi:hypothetical protein
MLLLLEGDGALGQLEALTFTGQAALTEFRNSQGQADQSVGVFTNGLSESRQVKLGKQFGDPQGDDLLDGFMDLVVVILAAGRESKLEVGTAFFDALLELKPTLVWSSFPPPEVGFVDGYSDIAHAFADRVIRDGFADHLIDGIANFFGQTGDFVPGIVVEFDRRRVGVGGTGRLSGVLLV